MRLLTMFNNVAAIRLSMSIGQEIKQMGKEIQNKRYRLYWIYDNRNSADPLKDGYIGVTSQTIGKRVAAHKKTPYQNNGTTKRPLYWILKDIPDENIEVKEICWTYDKVAMGHIERAFRPKVKIGWNSFAGGKIHNNTPRSFIIKNIDGTEAKYSSQWAAQKDGYDQGRLGQCLRGTLKSFDGGYTAWYTNTKGKGDVKLQ